ncbi:hypothetical protein T09_8972 [Trichinella sp. T9]|nr:hypothetical protein T09_8972 [Trichinella sp. T9]
MLTGKRSHQLFLNCVPDFAIICSAVSCSSCRVARSRENLLVDIDLSSSSYDKSVQTSKSKFFHKRIFFHLERPSNSGSTRQGLCLAQHSCIKQAYLLNTGPLKIRRNQILEFRLPEASIFDGERVRLQLGEIKEFLQVDFAARFQGHLGVPLCLQNNWEHFSDDRHHPENGLCSW